MCRQRQWVAKNCRKGAIHAVVDSKNPYQHCNEYHKSHGQSLRERRCLSDPVIEEIPGIDCKQCYKPLAPAKYPTFSYEAGTALSQKYQGLVRQGKDEDEVSLPDDIKRRMPRRDDGGGPASPAPPSNRSGNSGAMSPFQSPAPSSSQQTNVVTDQCAQTYATGVTETNQKMAEQIEDVEIARWNYNNVWDESKRAEMKETVDKFERYTDWADGIRKRRR